MFLLERSVLFVVLFVSLIFTMPLGSSATSGEVDSILEIDANYMIETSNPYIYHNPISINNNSDLSTQGWSGSGTVENPYVIEGLHIANELECISIKNTTLYLEVRNCFISSCLSGYLWNNDDSGILIEYAKHVTIQNCIIQWHSNGIRVIDSSNCMMQGNTIIESGVGSYIENSHSCMVTHSIVRDCSGGFDFLESPKSTVVNNIATNNSFWGFYFHESGNSTVANNIASRNMRYGIYLVDSSNSTVTNNFATRNIDGFQLERAGNSTVVNNTATDNSMIGIYLIDSSFCNITNNNLNRNWEGLILASDDCYVVNNTINENSYGLILWDDSCIIVNNSILDNRMYGISVHAGCRWNRIYLNRLGRNNWANAYDSTDRNTWDDGVSRGNYWMDYDGNGPYQISGPGGNFDNYPIFWKDVVAIENLERILIFTSVFSIATVIVLERIIRNRQLNHTI